MNLYSDVASHYGIALTLARTLTNYGQSADELFQQVGLPPLASFDTSDRLNSVTLQKLWRLSVVVTEDEAFGIRFAENLQPGTFHGLGFACMTSDTLGDALQRVAKYYRLMASAGEVVVDHFEQESVLWYKIPAPKGAGVPASLDAAMATMLKLCRLAIGDEFSGIRAELQRPTPVDATPFTSFFGSPVEFDKDENKIYFDPEVLAQQLPLANPELARANDKVVIDYLSKQTQGRVIDRIRGVIIDVLPTGAPSQNKIANQVNMSARTLQRRLKEDGYTFRELVEEIRRELSMTYLREARTIGEITYLLGYTEPTNFTRSFKRWTGESPASFRTSLS